MVANILDFRLSESLRGFLPGHFALPNYPSKVEFCIVFAKAFQNIHPTYNNRSLDNSPFNSKELLMV